VVDRVGATPVNRCLRRWLVVKGCKEMTDENQAEEQTKYPKISWVEFVQTAPIGTTYEVDDFVVQENHYWNTNQQPVRFHCNHEACNGERFFSSEE